MSCIQERMGYAIAEARSYSITGLNSSNS